MKIGKGNFTAVFKGLCFAVVIFVIAGISVRAYSDETPGSGAKVPAAAGGYVDDPTANVPTNAFVTFSTLYNGHRYYLGVDTVLAKSGKDTVMYYESPNYATMWIAGPMWSPTGKVLPTKDYTRTIKSVWLAERESRLRPGDAIGEYDFHSPVGDTPWIIIALFGILYLIRSKKTQKSEEKFGSLVKKHYLCTRFPKLR